MNMSSPIHERAADGSADCNPTRGPGDRRRALNTSVLLETTLRSGELGSGPGLIPSGGDHRPLRNTALLEQPFEPLPFSAGVFHVQVNRCFGQIRKSGTSQRPTHCLLLRQNGSEAGILSRRRCRSEDHRGEEEKKQDRKKPTSDRSIGHTHFGCEIAKHGRPYLSSSPRIVSVMW